MLIDPDCQKLADTNRPIDAMVEHGWIEAFRESPSSSCGCVSGYGLLAIGLINSTMFPTIFSLASEGLGPRAGDGSGIICMAIVGGAIVPPLVGHLADISGSLAFALTLPALCYAAIAVFGMYARRPATG